MSEQQERYARTDVPSLIAEVERLRADNAVLRQLIKDTAIGWASHVYYCIHCGATSYSRWELLHNRGCIATDAVAKQAKIVDRQTRPAPDDGDKSAERWAAMQAVCEAANQLLTACFYAIPNTHRSKLVGSMSTLVAALEALDG